ncbi:hypothetical protein U5817_06705 [Aromatoleum evansii]|uniref:Transposase n=1 Tax=Aromatoleum evansii TaxID=59406 RepID=A0ABZ1APC9_AROEV|nr:hypothetical protein U5817_06705 [Aromatoleum evansii]
MPMTQIDGLAYELDGDFIDLEQDCGIGEVDRIRLHRIHLAHLAELAGPLSADQTADRTIRTLQRRLLTLAREIHDVAEWVRSGADDETDTFPDFLMVTALDRLAQALIDDLPASNDDRRHQPSPEALPKAGPLNSPGIGPVAAGTAPQTATPETQMDLLEPLEN